MASRCKRARIRAIQRGESVNQYLADRLREYADDEGERVRRRASAQRFVALSEELSGSSHGRSWTRDELYADRLRQRG